MKKNISIQELKTVYLRKKRHDLRSDATFKIDILNLYIFLKYHYTNQAQYN